MSASVWVAPLDRCTLTVEIAFGADLTDLDGSGWSWTDVTEHVRQTPGISTSLGRGDEASRSQPAALQLVLDNTDGAYSLGGHSTHWPYVRRGTPVRVQVDPGEGDPAGAGARVLFWGFADGWTPSWEAAGAIPVVTLVASGTLRRLAQGQTPLLSAYRRSVIDSASVIAYWPMEELSGAQYAPAVRGGRLMLPSVPAAVRWASSDAFESSAALPDVGDSALDARLDPYTATGESEVSWFIIVPDDGLADGTVIASIYTTGTIGRWDVLYVDAGTGNLTLNIYNANGSLNSAATNVTFDMDGSRRRIELQLTQDGADIDWVLGVLDAQPGDGGGQVDGTVTARTFSTVSRVVFAPAATAAGTILGHLRVQDAVTDVFEAREAFWAWQRRLGSRTAPEFGSSGTVAASRLTRLCAENDLQLTRHTTTSLIDNLNNREGMGPQRPRTLLQLVQECEICDQGQVWDGRTPGLTITTRRYRELGDVALTLDAGAGELAREWTPVDDDQRTRNKVIAQRTAGVAETYEDTDGPLGSATVGTYDSSIEVNGSHDSMMLQHAAFQVSLGTVEGYRYPTVTIDLRATPDLAGTVLDLIPGDTIRVANGGEALAGFVPGVDVDLIVEGIAHELSAAGWRAVLRCSWASPWIVGLVAAESGDTETRLLRPDTDGATLVVPAALNTTTLYVENSAGAWTTAADDYPLTLDVGGLPVTATAAAADPGTDPAFGVAGTYLTGGNRTTTSVAAPAGVVAGSIVLVHLYIESTTLVTPPAGFLPLPEAPFTSGPATGMRVYWHRAAGAEAGPYAFTHALAFTEAVATRYSGVLQAGDPFESDVGSAQRSSAGTATPAVSLVTTGPGRLIVWAATSVAVGAWTPPAGYTERVDTGGELTVATLLQTAAGSTGSLSGTGPNDFMTAFALALVPAAQEVTVAALPYDRSAGVPVKLWDPRPLGL